MANIVLKSMEYSMCKDPRGIVNSACSTKIFIKREFYDALIIACGTILNVMIYLVDSDTTAYLVLILQRLNFVRADFPQKYKQQYAEILVMLVNGGLYSP